MGLNELLIYVDKNFSRLIKRKTYKTMIYEIKWTW